MKALLALPILSLMATSCCPPFCFSDDQPRKITIKDGEYIIPACKPMIKYTGKSFLVEGVSVPGSEGATSVAKVEVKDQQIQQAGQIAQIADIHRMAVCSTVGSSASISKQEYQRALEQMRNDQTVVTQFAIAATAGGDALGKYIDRYEPRKEAISQEVAKVSGSADTITVKDAKAAALSNPELISLESAGNKDYRASTVVPNSVIATQ